MSPLVFDSGSRGYSTKMSRPFYLAAVDTSQRKLPALVRGYGQPVVSYLRPWHAIPHRPCRCRMLSYCTVRYDGQPREAAVANCWLTYRHQEPSNRRRAAASASFAVVGTRKHFFWPVASRPAAATTTTSRDRLLSKSGGAIAV